MFKKFISLNLILNLLFLVFLWYWRIKSFSKTPKKIRFSTQKVFNNDKTKINFEASEPKWVNPVLNIIGVNSLRLGGLQINLSFTFYRFLKNFNFHRSNELLFWFSRWLYILQPIKWELTHLRQKEYAHFGWTTR